MTGVQTCALPIFPTAAYLTGDLSDEPRRIYDPWTTRDNPARPGTYIRDPFPGNRIPAGRLDQGMVFFAKNTLPEAMETGRPGFNALDTTPFRQTQDEYTARVDQNLGEKDFFWFRYSGTLQDRLGGRKHLENGIEDRAKNLAASWVHTFGPASVLQAQFARARMRDTTYNQFRDTSPDFYQKAGVSDNFAGHFVGGRTEMPALNVTDFFSGGESYQSMIPTDVWQAKANYSLIRGNHILKLGGEFNKSDFGNVIALANAGFITFQTSDPLNSGPTGSALASFLLNVPDNATRRNIDESVAFGGVIGFYLQDQWKATSRLTVNIGLRYDKSFMPTYGKDEDFTNETGNMDFNRGVYVLQKAAPPCEVRKTAPCIPTAGGALPQYVELSPNGRIYRGTSKNFQPRFGLAYRLTPRTALRASFGVFFDNWSAVNQMARNFGGAWPSVGFIQASNLNRPVPDQILPNKTVGNPLPAGVFPDTTPFRQVAWFADPNITNPYSLQWNGGIQHQLTPSTVITTNYVGSGSRRLDVGGYYNTALTPGPGNPQSRAPFPYISATNYDRSWGKASYHSFQFLLDRRFSNGMGAMVSYTWSKSIDIGCSGWFVEGCAVQDPYHLNNDRSVSGYDLPHVLTANWVYRLPFGKGMRFGSGSRVVDLIAGGWQFNGIARFHSGSAYNLSVNGDTANTGNASGYMRPNVVGDHRLETRDPELWFRKEAFAAPPIFTFGNLGRYVMRSDWNRNFDLSMFRQFPIGERRHVEFRAEAFHVFNTPIFGAPVSNINSPNFGRVLGAGGVRQLQLSLRIEY